MAHNEPTTQATIIRAYEPVGECVARLEEGPSKMKSAWPV